MLAEVVHGPIILGGGGHARVLIDTLRSAAGVVPCGVLDADESRWGQRLLDVPILGGDELLEDLIRRGLTHFLVGLGGARDNRPRRRLFELAANQGLTPMTVAHPSAVCSSWAVIGAGTVVYPTAVVNAAAELGVNVIVNTGAIVEHDCRVGDHAHVSTGATLCGAVRVGALAHVGAGATVRQGITIGEGAVVGAGAVVIDDVEPWTVVVGVPAARVLRPADHGAHHDGNAGARGPASVPAGASA